MAKISTLTDDFTTLNGAVWADPGSDSTATIVSGALKLQYLTGAGVATSRKSVTAYDLTDSYVLVQLADIGTRQTGWSAILTIIGSGSSNELRMYYSDEYGIVAQVFNGGSQVFIGQYITFDDAVHKWMRIRETAGTLYFESSANGVNWTGLYSTATSVISWSLTSVNVMLSAARSASNASNGYSSFDNFNIPPVTPQGNFFRFFGGYAANIGGDPASGPPSSGGGGGSPFITTMADIEWINWQPINGGGGVVQTSSFQEISTPSGPGFQVVCTDALNQAAWNVNNKAVLAMRRVGVGVTGATEDYTWDMYLPTQTVSVDQYTLFEFHTDASSGHNIGLNLDGTYRMTRQSAAGQVYVRNYTGGPAILYNVWQPMRIKVKWSLGSDGLLQMWINGTQVMNYTGPTQFAGDGRPYINFGWYGWRPSNETNTVRFANIQQTVT
jgi:hypothetical protein